MRFNFDKVNPAVFGNFDTSYDYMSVMHYPRWAFSTNGRDTMVPLDRRYLDYIGSPELSEGDVTRINNMYECYSKASSAGSWAASHSGRA
jgi:Astacin (Peptidase family M12A)